MVDKFLFRKKSILRKNNNIYIDLRKRKILEI